MVALGVSKNAKAQISKKQIIFPLNYINEHSRPNFGLLGYREAFPQMAIDFTKESSLKHKGDKNQNFTIYIKY